MKSQVGPRTLWWARIAIMLLVIVVLCRIYFRVTDDFRLANMSYDLPFHQEWEIPALSLSEQAQLDRIFDQKFFYLGKGAQSYVFTSADQRYVVKFFKFKHLKPSLIVTLIPNIPPFAEYQKREILRKEKKLNSVFVGHKLAYDEDQNDSGIIHMQLNPNHATKMITIVDKIGLERDINLGDVVYVIQEKGETLRTVLTELLDIGDLVLTKRRIDQIFSLYMSEYKKGIYDRDHGVMHNIGFVQDKPFHLDVGKLTKDNQIKQLDQYEPDLTKVANKIELWLRNNYPQYHKELTKHMEMRLSELFEHQFNFSTSR